MEKRSLHFQCSLQTNIYVAFQKWSNSTVLFNTCSATEDLFYIYFCCLFFWGPIICCISKEVKFTCLILAALQRTFFISTFVVYSFRGLNYTCCNSKVVKFTCLILAVSATEDLFIFTSVVYSFRGQIFHLLLIKV